MGKVKDAFITGTVALSITAVVLETDFNPAILASVIGAGCRTQKEIIVEYAYAKSRYTSLKYFALRNYGDLADFDRWIKDSIIYLDKCYLYQHIKKYREQQDLMDV